MKQLPLGISDYKEIIENDYLYIDKTGFIQELLSTGEKVTLICRPRRFGKTINLSMLRYFFEYTIHSHAYLFADKKIAHTPIMHTHQGKFPVLFLTLKDIKEKTFEQAYAKIVLMISQEFARNAAVLRQHLDQHQRRHYDLILNELGSTAHVNDSLRFLTELLHTQYQKRVIVLIDEYDTPLAEAFLHGYYNEMITVIKSLFGALLKDNRYLERAVLTGILRTSKEGIFSDLNNIVVCTLLRTDYADSFGFTQTDVEDILKESNFIQTIEAITQWYNGYLIGESTRVYNPWSILECIRNNGVLSTYWANTSSNNLIKYYIARASHSVKQALERVITDDPIIKVIDEGVTFETLIHQEESLWSLLLFSGYLTFAQKTLTSSGAYACSLIIPNDEIRELYKNLITTLFTQSLQNNDDSIALLNSFLTGDVPTFEFLLQHYIINMISYYDFSLDEPEKSYHLFILGLLVFLEKTHYIRSNRESGFGRYDIMLIPRQKTLTACGIIVKFKKAFGQESLEEAAERALEQIHNKHYAQELQREGITNIRAYGIAFKGKKVIVGCQHI